MKHVMVDIETLDTAPSSVVLSIGAVKFDFASDNVDTFQINLDIQDQINMGRTISADTLIWWTKQPCIELSTINPVNVCKALNEFVEWLGSDIVGLWGNGVAFDNVILVNLFRSIGLSPLDHRKDRCFRTIKSLFPLSQKISREGVYHNSVDDALHQVRVLKAIYNEYNLLNVAL